MKNCELLYTMKDWKETVIQERADGFKTSRVEAAFAYEGELAGQATASYLLHYHPDGNGSYFGWEHFDGLFQGAPGAVVFRVEGSFDPKGVDARVVNESGSGRGGLKDMILEYDVRFEGEGPYPLTLSID
jgi:hypothetical protein